MPAFLHTAPAVAETMERLLPGSVHLVDESLLVDARSSGPDAVAGRVAARLAQLQEQTDGPVVVSCSTIGDVAERTPGVIRIDRPMARRAAELGGRVGVVVALESTIEPTTRLLREEGVGDMVVRLAEGAWGSGDYLERIAETARSLTPEADVIVLAQASMAGAAGLLDFPVLTSPEIAAEFLTR
ncbi:hypothetical protein [Corynebacterium guangdongense]|uniref:Asp/Glu/Hydantoin racemase n=1 Tax=Corynebacterium guangdongense TaxID=1783348 RepID=A0ABU1ZZS5_9CORY|nr:hypothetical protein [Corynebacterium guangdongense]MDR7330419.1 hypothetical protein [Corynebacterium guangdongense]WJZ18977.1 Asp/Glu/Hydantoin racemase [Corynebacterium guangdongense]